MTEAPRPRRSFLRRVFLAYALGFASLWLALGVAVDLYLKGRVMGEARQSLHATGAMLAAMLAANPMQLLSLRLDALVREVGEETGLAIAIVGAPGEGLAVSGPRARRLLAWSGGKRPPAFATVRLGPDGERAFCHAAPILAQSDLLGFAILATPLEPVRGEIAALRWRLAGLGTLGAALALGGGYLVARRALLPLQETARACRDLAKGRREVRLTEGRDDEFGLVARAFNQMAEEMAFHFQAATRERNRHMALLAALDDGVVAIGAEGRIFYANRAAAHLLGRPRETLRGGLLDEVAPGLELSELVDRSGLALTTCRGERQWRRPDGAGLCLSVSAACLATAVPNGLEESEAGCLIVLRDVTRLSELETARQRFTANVSHELKTPIAAMQALIETALAEGGEDRVYLRGSLLKALRQNARLMRLANDLLAIARMERGELELGEKPVDVAAVFEACLETFRPLADKRGARVEVEVRPPGLRVAGDSEALEMAVNNLLDNALRHSPEGGTVRMEACAFGGSVHLRVRDQGPGIDPALRGKVFERFFRGDPARARAPGGGGSGLGLAIVKWLAIAMKGAARLEASSAEGCVFLVELPLSRGGS